MKIEQQNIVLQITIGTTSLTGIVTRKNWIVEQKSKHKLTYTKGWLLFISSSCWLTAACLRLEHILCSMFFNDFVVLRGLT